VLLARHAGGQHVELSGHNYVQLVGRRTNLDDVLTDGRLLGLQEVRKPAEHVCAEVREDWDAMEVRQLKRMLAAWNHAALLLVEVAVEPVSLEELLVGSLFD